MFFLFCQPGLSNRNTIDFLIKKLLLKKLKIKNKNYSEINSFNSKLKKNTNLNSYFKKLKMLIDAFKFFIKLEKILAKKKVTHIFLDSYTILDLLFFSLYKFPLNIKIIIYLRIPYDLLNSTKLIFFLSILNLKKKNVKFITDTLQLKKHFKKKYKINCDVIPIPSKINTETRLKKINSKKIKIIFPGKSRNEKGIENIIELFKNKKTEELVELYFNRNDFLFNSLRKIQKLKLTPLSPHLSYKNYLRSLIISHYVILPYTHKTYRLRSSGVFIDAIKLNKFCFVSKDTWMSSFLKRYKLEIFIINNWDFEELNKKIKYIDKNFKKIKKNFSKMRYIIINHNSDSKFKNKMKEIFFEK